MSDVEQPLTIERKSPSTFKRFIHSNLPIVLGGIIVGGGSLILGYSIGHQQGLTAVGFAADAEQLNEVVQEQKQEINILNTTLNTTVQERDVALTNLKEITESYRKETDLREQAEQQRDIYREILRLRGGVALTVQNVDIKPLPERAYEYRLDLMQLQPNKRRASGTAQIRLIGDNNNILVVPMSDNSYGFDSFQRLTGRWTMPSGFTPEFIEVRLQGNGSPVIKRYAWERGAPVKDMPAILSEIPQTEANAD
ncbi:hypothetical protein BKE30_00430 [Alkanindiges hydrocarboniclasticus]|uniref:Uncharacterized protein n=1 Tax=Alkanindiges hydrocarboniclasticus TaxID=1907941 RepID=A0A1S8CY84_9GAMM|nr:DUF6776 family protein [Alkanindiges hydrocarboniclasticus]ONG42307.1 hypothetical protein BKE30_00430 [Alkanindiges hydrocarboniclasticus]